MVKRTELRNHQKQNKKLLELVTTFKNYSSTFPTVFPDCFHNIGFQFLLVSCLKFEPRPFSWWFNILSFIRLEDYYSSNIPYTEGNDAIDSDVDECSNPSSIRSS